MKLRAATLLATLALGLLAAPLPAQVEKVGKVYRVGWLGPYERAYAAMAFRLSVPHILVVNAVTS